MKQKGILILTSVACLSIASPLAMAQQPVSSPHLIPEPVVTQNLFQRSCNIKDIDVYKNTSMQTATCSWQPSWEKGEDKLKDPASNHDVGVQMTLHDPDNTVDYILGTCTFVPVDAKNPDLVTKVEGHKGAELVSYTIDMDRKFVQTIKFIVQNNKQDPNINVAVRVNYPSLGWYNAWELYAIFAMHEDAPVFTPGDTMDCTMIGA